MQWTTPVAGVNLFVSVLRLREGAVMHEGDEGVENGIQFLDAIETGGGEFHRGNLFATQ